MFYVDAHLDLAYNALNYQRPFNLSVKDIRAREGKKPVAGIATVSFPDLKVSEVGLIFATLFAFPAGSPTGMDGAKYAYRNAAEAHQQAMAQLDCYHRLADDDPAIRFIGDRESLNELIASWKNDGERLLGIVPLMEGADPIQEPEECELWYGRGVRVIGPAWDDTRYAAGAWRGSQSGLTTEGHHLLDVMAEMGFILDISHMNEKASFEAIERYEGFVVATHSNVRTLVPGERHLGDVQIRALGERDGVMGIVLYNRFLKAGYYKGDPKQRVTLDHVVAHIDHICQLLGDAAHVGIGSDLDGGFGVADIPAEMDTVHDLTKIGSALKLRGYDEADIVQIMGGNWVSLLQRAFT